MQIEEVEDILDPTTHGVRRDADVLHGVGQLVLDRVGDEAGGGILTDHTHYVGQIARQPFGGRSTVDADPTRQRSPGEPGNVAVRGA